MKNISYIIKNIRMNLFDMNLNQFAKAVGVPVSTLHRVEEKGHSIEFDKLTSIRNYGRFNIPGWTDAIMFDVDGSKAHVEIKMAAIRGKKEIEAKEKSDRLKATWPERKKRKEKQLKRLAAELSQGEGPTC